MGLDFLLVGGYGYLGVNVASRLSSLGYSVGVLARRTSVRKRGFLADAFARAGVVVYVVDGPSIGRGDLASKDADVIVQMAGVIGSRPRMKEAHVDLTREAAEAAAETGSFLVFISAVAAVGRLGGRVVRDGRPSETRGEPEGPYEETKAEGESVVESYDSRLRGRWLVVRPGLVVGLHAYHPEWRWLRRLASLRLAPRLGSRIPFTHAYDVASTLELAYRGRLARLAVHPVTAAADLWDLAGRACRAAGRSCTPLPAGALLRLLCPLAPAGGRLGLACRMLRRRYVFDPAELARAGFKSVGVDALVDALAVILGSSAP